MSPLTYLKLLLLFSSLQFITVLCLEKDELASLRRETLATGTAYKRSIKNIAMLEVDKDTDSESDRSNAKDSDPNNYDHDEAKLDESLNQKKLTLSDAHTNDHLNHIDANHEFPSNKTVSLNRHSAEKSIKLLTGNPENVLGQPLVTCSVPGEALTGFTRTGMCVDQGDDDAGSHHICVEMEADFCTTTGQSNWCEDKMECMGQSGQCDIKHWCVCQWAFARYLDLKNNDCANALNVKCEAVNQAAVIAYEQSTDATHKAALVCLKQKCNLNSNTTRTMM